MSDHMISYYSAVKEAHQLKSADGENKEYDRALVELISYLYDMERPEVASDIGINPDLFD